MAAARFGSKVPGVGCTEAGQLARFLPVSGGVSCSVHGMQFLVVGTDVRMDEV